MLYSSPTSNSSVYHCVSKLKSVKSLLPLAAGQNHSFHSKMLSFDFFY